ncbi:MAG: guanitoxin biosynthesis heme-dependent pre-guanitoxin N-hydroxylase GntA [Sphingomonadaceae bacterium]
MPEGIDWVNRLREFIESREFPCVGAKAVLNRDWLGSYIARDLESAWDDLAIHDRLLEWAYDYRDNPTGLRSFAVIFAARKDFDERQFEALMWERLQSLADKDHWRGQKLDASVSADPSDPHFSLSFGGQAFFVVGLHPCASRKARRFDRPAMIFNLHDQFERLRDEGRYERMREAILARDEAYSGSINPMLSRHGDASEARQYSGREVGENWSCPFRDPRTESK